MYRFSFRISCISKRGGGVVLRVYVSRILRISALRCFKRRISHLVPGIFG